MTSHVNSVFTNSCLRVPVDPRNKLPSAEFDRNKMVRAKLRPSKRDSLDSSTSGSTLIKQDDNVTHFREFYNSIPDYKDLLHLPSQEFYSTLQCLREKKRLMLGYTEDNIDDNNRNTIEHFIDKTSDMEMTDYVSLEDDDILTLKSNKTSLNEALKDKYKSHLKIRHEFGNRKKINEMKNTYHVTKVDKNIVDMEKKYSNNDFTDDNRLKSDSFKSDQKIKGIRNTSADSRGKRNGSTCSIKWEDKVDFRVKDEVDAKFDKFFNQYDSECAINTGKSRSLPNSPKKKRRSLSPTNKVTIPKPFKMTLRDEDDKTVTDLKELRRSLSADMLARKGERFRARSPPLASRVPLYRHILEDQETRSHHYTSNPRAISKINSEAALAAQMKPFRFAEREAAAAAVRGGVCSRLARDPAPTRTPTQPLPKPSGFRAKPVPKNLFSNYVYDKMREDDFYRALNRRIRAEELLKTSALPPSMAQRKSSQCSSRLGARPASNTTDAQSALRESTPENNRDTFNAPSRCGVRSNSNCSSNKKTRRKGRGDVSRNSFITTSTQPFHFNTASRASKKATLRKIYKETPTISLTPSVRPLSALEVRSINRSNLAAILRIESTKKRLEEEIQIRLDEERTQAEMKWRDHILRRKPAWQTVKSNHEEDLAIRLQTRRDEERLRREEFLHEMELMYGRVRDQPLLFERYYRPRMIRSDVVLDKVHSDAETLLQSPRKPTKFRKSLSNKKRAKHSLHYPSPRVRKTSSIENMIDMNDDELLQYLDKYDEDDERVFSSSHTAGDGAVDIHVDYRKQEKDK